VTTDNQDNTKATTTDAKEAKDDDVSDSSTTTGKKKCTASLGIQVDGSANEWTPVDFYRKTCTMLAKSARTWLPRHTLALTVAVVQFASLSRRRRARCLPRMKLGSRIIVPSQSVIMPKCFRHYVCQRA